MKPASFPQTTVGKKVVMAITGLMMVGFVIIHASGNLLVFRGREALDHYAELLQSSGGVKWAARAVLLGAVCLHFWAAASLSARNREARPVPYASKQPQVSTFSSRTMWPGGLMLAGFIVFHILHFTTGTIQPAPIVHGKVYDNIFASFQVPWVAGLYIVAMLALGSHLLHGAWSSIRTLGLAKPSNQPLHKKVAPIVAALVWLAFTSIPLAIVTGLVQWVK